MKAAALASVVLAVTAALADAQPSGSASGEASADVRRMRYQIRVMERVLEQAVQHSAQVVALRMRSLAPSTVLFTGPTHARGFKLDGYGVFFDVQVPTLRRSITWTFRTLSQHQLALGDAFQALRQHVRSLGDVGAREGLEQALRSLEVQVGPIPGGDPSETRATAVGAGQDVIPAAPPRAIDKDPGDVYAEQIRTELIDVMLDYSGSLLIEPDEWFTVAVSGAGGSFTPNDPSGRETTTILRISGRDLAAFHAEEVTRDAARNRVETQEF